MKSIIKTFILLIIIPATVFSADYTFKVLENTAERIKLNISFEKPQIVTENGMQIARYKNANLVIVQDNLLVPQVAKFFNLAAETDITPRIISVEWEKTPVKNYFTVKSENVQAVPVEGNRVVQSKFIGKRKSIPVHILQIYPVRIDKSASVLSWIKSMVIELAAPGAKTIAITANKLAANKDDFNSKIFINKKDEIYKTAQISGAAKSITSTPGINPILNKDHIFKLAVNETGMYQVTYDDLLEAEYPVDNINPQRLSLFSRGKEIAIYFKGAADGTFDEGDYFEFWGKKNEKTFLKQFPDLG
ncbi:MAG: hypothetical protein P8X42_07735 [Calditrichaceae bacterium]